MTPFDDTSFWTHLETIVLNSEVIIDRPKGTAHPRFQDFIYPVDYGYVKDTKAADGNKIDIFVGTASKKEIIGVLCTVDPLKKDTEIKILFSCLPEEIQTIYTCMAQKMGALFIPKNN